MSNSDSRRSDDYLEIVSEDCRRALEDPRAKIRSIVPAAEERISYRIPALRLNGVVVALLHDRQGLLVLPVQRFDAQDPRARNWSLPADEGLAPLLRRALRRVA